MLPTWFITSLRIALGISPASGRRDSRADVRNTKASSFRAIGLAEKFNLQAQAHRILTELFPLFFLLYIEDNFI